MSYIYSNTLGVWRTWREWPVYHTPPAERPSPLDAPPQRCYFVPRVVILYHAPSFSGQGVVILYHGRGPTTDL